MAAKEIVWARVTIVPYQPSSFWIFNFITAILVGISWSMWPTLCAGYAAATLKGVDADIVRYGNEVVQLELQRSVQKHFLDYGIYLPLEDIMFTQRLLAANKDLENGIRRACGDGPFALWIPVVVKIPLIGERSSEWCWKPTLKK